MTVPNLGSAQIDRFDLAGGIAHIDDIADAVLVLDEHEDPAEEVFDQALCSEADGNAHDPGTGDQRPKVDVELAERHHDRNEIDDGRGDRPQHGTKRLGTLFRPLNLYGLSLFTADGERLQGLEPSGRTVTVGGGLLGIGQSLGLRVDEAGDGAVDPTTGQPVDHPGRDQNEEDLGGLHHEVRKIGGGAVSRRIEHQLANETRIRSAHLSDRICGQNHIDHCRDLPNCDATTIEDRHRPLAPPARCRRRYPLVGTSTQCYHALQGSLVDKLQAMQDSDRPVGVSPLGTQFTIAQRRAGHVPARIDRRGAELRL